MKAAVVEDSELAREGLVSMLESYNGIELTCAADHTNTALPLLREEPVDVIFLDIHMPGSTGFDLLAKLNYSPLIIFTTAYSEHAIRSFDYNTVDYLLKPISRERLNQAIDKLRKQFSLLSVSQNFSEQLEVEVPQEQMLEMNNRMLIKDNDKCYLVELQSIRYFESCQNEARIFFGEDNAFVNRPLSQLEKRLPEKGFFRANRQYIVNLQAIKSIEESISRGYSLIMSDDKEIEVSRRRVGQLKGLMSF